MSQPHHPDNSSPHRRRLGVVLAAAAVGLAACGSSAGASSSPSTSGSKPKTNATSTPKPVSLPADYASILTSTKGIKLSRTWPNNTNTFSTPGFVYSISGVGVAGNNYLLTYPYNGLQNGTPVAPRKGYVLRYLGIKQEGAQSGVYANNVYPPQTNQKDYLCSFFGGRPTVFESYYLQVGSSVVPLSYITLTSAGGPAADTLGVLVSVPSGASSYLIVDSTAGTSSGHTSSSSRYQKISLSTGRAVGNTTRILSASTSTVVTNQKSASTSKTESDGSYNRKYALSVLGVAFCPYLNGAWAPAGKQYVVVEATQTLSRFGPHVVPDGWYSSPDYAGWILSAGGVQYAPESTATFVNSGIGAGQTVSTRHLYTTNGYDSTYATYVLPTAQTSVSGLFRTVVSASAPNSGSPSISYSLPSVSFQATLP